MNKESQLDALLYGTLQGEEAPPAAVQAQLYAALADSRPKAHTPWWLFAAAGALQTLAVWLLVLVLLPHSVLPWLLLPNVLCLILCAHILSAMARRAERKTEEQTYV